jgi:hypothetical protein
MKNQKTILFSILSVFSLLSVTSIYAATDLSVYAPASQQVNNQTFPRQLTSAYYNQDLKESDFKSVLRAYFEKNKNIDLYSKLTTDINMKLQGEKVDNDVYKYIRKSKLKSLIKSEKRSYKGIQSAINVLNSYLSNYDQATFQSKFLDLSNSSVESSLFINFSTQASIKTNREYSSLKLYNLSNLFDYSFYDYVKNSNKKFSNRFISPSVQTNATIESYEVRRSDTSIRYGFYEQDLGNESMLLVFEGEKSNCIMKVSDFNFSFCKENATSKISLNKSPKLIGIIKKCTKSQSCSVPDSIWKNFDQFSNRKLSSHDLKAIERTFSSNSQNHLHFETPLLPIAGGSFSNSVAINDPLFEELNDIAKNDSVYHGLKVKRIYTNYSSKSSLSVTYKLDDQQCRKAAKQGEECLALNEALYFVIPTEFQNKTISEMTIAHRQSTQDNRGTDSFNASTGTKVKDEFPSFISAQIYSPLFPYKYAWRYWGGHTSGINGGKYSEHKKNGSWEFDNLYEWPLYGHRASHQQIRKSISPLMGKYLRIFADTGKFSRIQGYDTAYVHSVTIQFSPKKADIYKSWSFTNSKTDLGDPLTMKGRTYGGGPKFQGQYPGAVILRGNSRPQNVDKLDSSTWDYSWRGYIEYALIPGKKLKSIEIAAGDTHPDGRPNKDGGTGSLGGAKLSVELLTKSGDQMIIKRANLGPKGVTTGYPQDLDRVIQKGETLRIYGHNDKAYLMGIRIGYGN